MMDNAANVEFAVYPWGSLPADATIVDVGGGNGHAMLDLLKAFPSFKAIVQDTRAIAIQGREVLSPSKGCLSSFPFSA